MSDLARPELPATHPQNVPLDQWTEGWLKLSAGGHTGELYILMTDQEKQARGWPVSREQMIDFLIAKEDIPAAGITKQVQPPTRRRCEGGPVEEWGECFECNAIQGEACLKPNP